MTYFAVITGIEGENNCSCIIMINPEGENNLVGSKILVDPEVSSDEFAQALTGINPDTIDMSKKQFLFGNRPAFVLGEIMVMDSHDRTIPDGRKPSKWWVSYERFDDIEDAIKRSKEVSEGEGL